MKRTISTAKMHHIHACTQNTFIKWFSQKLVFNLHAFPYFKTYCGRQSVLGFKIEIWNITLLSCIFRADFNTYTSLVTSFASFTFSQSPAYYHKYFCETGRNIKVRFLWTILQIPPPHPTPSRIAEANSYANNLGHDVCSQKEFFISYLKMDFCAKICWYGSDIKYFPI